MNFGEPTSNHRVAANGFMVARAMMDGPDMNRVKLYFQEVIEDPKTIDIPLSIQLQRELIMLMFMKVGM